MSARSRRHLGYAVLLGAVLVIGQYPAILPLFRSRLMEYLGIGDVRFGLIFSVGYGAGIVGVLIAGAIDRWGARRIIRLCLAGVAVSMLALGLGGKSLAMFISASCLFGVFGGPLMIASAVYLAKLFPGRQRGIMSLNLALGSVGGLFFPIIVEGLISVSGGNSAISFGKILHIPFLVFGAALLLASFAYAGQGRRCDPAMNESCIGIATGAAIPILRDLFVPWPMMFLVFLLALHGAVDTAFYIWISRFLESSSFNGGKLPFAPGLVLSAFSVAYLVSRILLFSLPERFGRTAFLMLPGIMGGGVAAAGILSRDATLAACGYVLGAFCWSAECPSMSAALLRIDKGRFGSAMALSGLVSACLIFLVVNAMGLLASKLGEAQLWKLMLIPACGFVMVGIGGFCWSVWYGGFRVPKLISQDSTQEQSNEKEGKNDRIRHEMRTDVCA